MRERETTEGIEKHQIKKVEDYLEKKKIISQNIGIDAIKQKKKN